MEYTSQQMMAIALSKEIKDGKTYIIGTGLPLIGGALAKHTHAPNASLLFETGVIEGNPPEVPKCVADLRNAYRASVLWPQYRYFGFQTLSGKRHYIDAGFLGGAQIDPYGNLNSTSVGDYHRPVTRLSGSGGANGIATWCDTVIVMKHEKRRFVEHVDYCTSPGWVDGPDGRAKRGLPADRGPRAVITRFGVFRFGEDKRMYLAELFPGTKLEDIVENTGFEMDLSRYVMAEAPDEETLRILTTEVDPEHLMV